MKKYIAPKANKIEFQIEGIIASSPSMSVDFSDDNAGDEQFSNSSDSWFDEDWSDEEDY